MSTDKEWQVFFTMVDQDIQRLGLTAEEAVNKWQGAVRETAIKVEKEKEKEKGE